MFIVFQKVVYGAADKSVNPHCESVIQPMAAFRQPYYLLASLLASNRHVNILQCSDMRSPFIHRETV